MRLRVCLLLALFPYIVAAQVFMRPVDNAAALSMGGAVVAYPGLAAGLPNDALPAFGDRRGVFLGSALPYGVAGWQTAHIQGFTRLSTNDGIGLDIAHSGIEAYGEQRLRLLYGRRLGARLLLGGSADVLRVSAQEYGQSTGVSFSLGVLANPLPGIWLGAQVHNPLQFRLEGTPTATRLRVGAAWRASSALLLAAETEKDLERPAQVKAGIEYRPVGLLVLRAGVRTGPGRWCFGAGVRLKNGLTFDTGAEWHPVLGITPAAMVAWTEGH